MVVIDMPEALSSITINQQAKNNRHKLINLSRLRTNYVLKGGEAARFQSLHGFSSLQLKFVFS
jgi:hypothetical protein